MATKFEEFWTGGNSGAWAGGSYWQSQGFGPQTKHKIEYVILYCYSAGARAGTVTLSIYPSQGTIPNGKPNIPAGALVAMTVAGSALPNGAYGNYQFNFPSFPTLNKDTLYHIVMSYTGAGFPGDYVYWRLNNNGGYARGMWWRSVDGGSSWDDLGGANDDMYFQDWGTVVRMPAVRGPAAALLKGGFI